MRTRRGGGGMVTVSVTTKYNHLSRMKRNLPVATSKIMRRAAIITHREARRMCPRDTGTLANSITMEGVTVGSLSMRVMTLAGYGAYVNFGTRYMAAQPFMTQAARIGREAFLADLANLEAGLL